MLFFFILSPFRVYINIICVRVCTGVARSVITLLLLINSAAVPCVCWCLSVRVHVWLAERSWACD